MPVSDCTAVILAGGESRRMGKDKASTLLHGKPLLQHVLVQVEPLFSDVLISVRELRADIVNQQIVDDSTDRGPMVGIKAALEQVQTPWIFVIGCDMPFVSTELIQQLALHRDGHQAVVTHVFDRPQPLFGFYSKSCLPLMAERIEQGERSMIRLLDVLHTCMLSELQVKTVDPQFSSLMSLDTIEDVSRVESMHE